MRNNEKRYDAKSPTMEIDNSVLEDGVRKCELRVSVSISLWR